MKLTTIDENFIEITNYFDENNDDRYFEISDILSDDDLSSEEKSKEIVSIVLDAFAEDSNFVALFNYSEEKVNKILLGLTKPGLKEELINSIYSSLDFSQHEFENNSDDLVVNKLNNLVAETIKNVKNIIELSNWFYSDENYDYKISQLQDTILNEINSQKSLSKTEKDLIFNKVYSATIGLIKE